MRKIYTISILLSLLITTHSQNFPLEKLHLDHVVIAVRDIDSMKLFFEILGFTVKPGRLHENSINNFHVKFADTSSIEIINATKKRDEISAWYVDRINIYPEGSGAFVAVRAEDSLVFKEISRDLLNKIIVHKIYEMNYANIISFDRGNIWHSVFFILYKTSISEEDKYIKHSNTARGLSEVTLALPLNKESNNVFNKENYLSSGIIHIDRNETDKRISEITIEFKDLDAIKDNLRKVNRKKYIVSTEYDKNKIAVHTKFNLTINFVKN